MKKLLFVCLLLASCTHNTKVNVNNADPEWVFCDHVQDILEKKVNELHKGLLEQENVVNAIFSNFKIACEKNKAYAAWNVVLEMQNNTEKKCASFNTIVSFTDEPDQIVYELLYISEGEPVECLTSS